MKRAYQTKIPCSISSDALHLLTATAGAVLLLPLEGYERKRVEEAIAQAWHAMIIASGLPAYKLPSEWLQEELHD